MENGTKLIVFDFDGVLADSFDAFFSLTRDGMKSIGLSMIPDQYRNLFKENVHQGLRDFINNEKKYLAYSEFRKNNYDKYYKINLFSGAVDMLKQLQKNYILTIASSGKEKNIKKLLKTRGVEHLFSLILADSAPSKEGMIIKILNKFNCNPKSAVMVTDTVGDLKIAKKLGLKTAVVAWGFHSAKILKREKPDYLAKSFKMLYKNLKAF